MDLIYTSPEETTIQATLYEGESLGNHQGPAVVYVPTDPTNVDYQAILASGEPIAPYVPPPEPEPQPLTLEAHPQSDMDATTMESVKTYVSAEVQPLRDRIAALEARMLGGESG